MAAERERGTEVWPPTRKTESTNSTRETLALLPAIAAGITLFIAHPSRPLTFLVRYGA